MNDTDPNRSPTNGMGGGKLKVLIPREDLRLLPLFIPITLVGLAGLAAASVSLARATPSLGALGVVLLLAAAVVSEMYPVPVARVPGGKVSLAAVFVVAAAVLYGAGPAFVVSFLTRSSIDVVQRRGLVRLAYNGAAYGLAGGAAGLAAAAVPEGGNVIWLFLQVLAGASSFYAVNIPLVAGILSLFVREPFLQVLRRAVVWTAPTFALMASVSLMLVPLWQRSPALAGALAGPLLAVSLYQRSLNSALDAMRLALTDPLTGLGNHRAFDERLDAALAGDGNGHQLSICLLDLDDFKRINDGYGHPTGDRVLVQTARVLAAAGDAFRLGGDEFAIVLPVGEVEAAAVGERAIAQLAAVDWPHGSPVGFSAGVAAAPSHAADREELVRLADLALYSAKAEGKNRVRVYQPDVATLASLEGLPGRADPSARMPAAAALARVVDERDGYVGAHSRRVAEVAGAIARRLGLDPKQVELVRLAGALHDIGKLAIAAELLRKEGPLAREERAELERHAEIGYRILDALGMDPLATWVLHHHERWDGQGYPHGLAGERIPLGSRILLVADAYDAIVDRLPRTPEEAVEELVRHAGTQFDAQVVAALVAVFAERGTAAAA